MQQNNYIRLAWIAGFLLFAFISCAATAESLHMLVPSLPSVFWWFVSVGIFIIASLGTKMIVDSLNTNIYIEKRGLRLCGGIIILLIFWLVFSFPTNTHTFFYRSSINDKVMADISITKGYLNQIISNTGNQEQAQKKIEEMRTRVGQLLNNLQGEICNPNNPGFGTASKETLGKLANALGVPEIIPLSVNGTSQQDLQELCKGYRQEVMDQLKVREAQIKEETRKVDTNNLNEAKAIYGDLDRMQKYIAEGTINLNDSEQVAGPNGICNKLNEAYNIIKKNKTFVNFSNKDEEIYTAPEPMTKVRRMIDPRKVWIDYVHGDYSGQDFLTFILFSLIVDIAAFIFFDLAFRKEQ